jgi:polyisoprenoid-binding protein YceI
LDQAWAAVCGSGCSRRHRAPAAAALLLAAFSPTVSRAADAAGWSIQNGDVRISVPLRPGGAFEAKTSAMLGRVRASGSRPVLLTGEIAVDLTTIDTGIDLRNRHLRENYLQVAKGPGFDKAVLSEIRVPEASGEAFRGRSAFTATLLLHGVKAAVSGACEIKADGNGVRVEASFALALRDFGIEPPEYMGVGVGNKLLVKLAFSAVPRGAGE